MRLCINIDHVATLRNARGEMQPDPVTLALLCEQAGADGIVVHLREDRRHIKDRDVKLLRELLTTKLDLEMAATPEIIAAACNILPDLVTIVPEKRMELTTEGGLNVLDNIEHLKDTIKELHKHRIEVSLFIEPDIEQINAASDIQSDFIEIHTGIFANAGSLEEEFEELEKVRLAAKHAKKLGMGVNAGHGLNYQNMKTFRNVPDIDEVSIGHSIIARALYVGLPAAVKEMFEVMKTS